MTPAKLNELKKNLTDCIAALKDIKLCYTGRSVLNSSGINPQAAANKIYEDLENFAQWATVKVLIFFGVAQKRDTDSTILAKAHKAAFEAITTFIMAVDAVLNSYTEAQHACLDRVLKQLSGLAKDMLIHLNSTLKLLASSNTPGYHEQLQQHTKTLRRISQFLSNAPLGDHEDYSSNASSIQTATLILSTASTTLSLRDNLSDVAQASDDYWSDWSYQHSDTLPLPSSGFTTLSANDWQELRDSLNIPIDAKNKIFSDMQSIENLFTSITPNSINTVVDTAWTQTVRIKHHAANTATSSFISSFVPPQTSTPTPVATSSQQIDLPTTTLEPIDTTWTQTVCIKRHTANTVALSFISSSVPPQASTSALVATSSQQIDLPTTTPKPINLPINLFNETVAAIKIFCESYPADKPNIIHKLEAAIATIETEDNAIILQTVQQIANQTQTIGTFFQNLWTNDQRTDQFYQILKKLDLKQSNTLKNLINFVIQNINVKSTPIITVQYL